VVDVVVGGSVAISLSSKAPQAEPRTASRAVRAVHFQAAVRKAVSEAALAARFQAVARVAGPKATSEAGLAADPGAVRKAISKGVTAAPSSSIP
jgi:hypothetical protein